MGLIDSAINFVSGLVTNASNRDIAQQTSETNRRIALDTANLESKNNIAFWKMQNEYNTPLAQMQRFEEAGLNKNLIYGQGTPGNAGAISPYQVDQVTQQTPHLQAPQMSPFSILGMYNDLRQTNANVNRTNAETDAIRVKTANDQLNADLIREEIFGKRFQNTLNTQTFENQVDSFKLKNDQLKASIASELKNLGYKDAQITETMARVELLLSQNAEQDFKNELWSKGINPNTPVWEKAILEFINNLTGETPGNVLADAYKGNPLHENQKSDKLSWKQILWPWFNLDAFYK